MAIILVIMLTIQSCVNNAKPKYTVVSQEIKCYSGGKLIYSTNEPSDSSGAFRFGGLFEIETPTDMALTNADCIMISHHKKGE